MKKLKLEITILGNPQLEWLQEHIKEFFDKHHYMVEYKAELEEVPNDPT